MLLWLHNFGCLFAFFRQLSRPATSGSERPDYNVWQGYDGIREKRVQFILVPPWRENALPLSLPVSPCFIFYHNPNFTQLPNSSNISLHLDCVRTYVCISHLDRYLHVCVSECVCTITLSSVHTGRWHTELIRYNTSRENRSWKLFFPPLTRCVAVSTFILAGCTCMIIHR